MKVSLVVLFLVFYLDFNKSLFYIAPKFNKLFIISNGNMNSIIFLFLLRWPTSLNFDMMSYSWSVHLISITLLSRIIYFLRECRVAIGTMSGRSQ